MKNIVKPKIIYAGDRDISVWVLKFIISQGILPSALLVSGEKRATHDKGLIKLCRGLDPSKILRGNAFRQKKNIDLIKSLKPDYIICVHFPYVVPKEVLDIPKEGVLNLHPAYLSYNRGWHTPTWAIFDGTPYGATLHFMDEGIDTGDIVHQKNIKVLPDDTAHKLYSRVKQLEFETFKEAWPSLLAGTYLRLRQFKKDKKSTFHTKKDISSVQMIDLKKKMKAQKLIDLLRALTTNDIKEAAYYNIDGKKYRIQINIFQEP